MMLRVCKRLLSPAGKTFLLICLCWLIALQLYIFAMSRTASDIKEYLQPPYKENIWQYDVNDRQEHRDNFTIARRLARRVRVHCLLLLTNNHEKAKMEHVMRSWPNRCNHIHLHEAREEQTLQVYARIYKQFKFNFDWLLQVQVDSYVVMENLRYVLSRYDPAEPLYFSAYHKAYPYAHVSLRDTTDYVLSRGALQQLLAKAHDQQQLMHALMNNLRLDSAQLNPFQANADIIPFTERKSFWMWPMVHQAVYGGGGFNGTVPFMFILPYVNCQQLYVLEYLLYHLRPYGMDAARPAVPSLGLPARAANNTLATQLAQRVRVICMIITCPHKCEASAKPIMETWGRRCHKLIMFSSREQRSIPGAIVVPLDVDDGYDLLWNKTRAAFRYVHQHYLQEGDWFFKADDDTFVIMENMRYMLHGHSPNEPIYFGFKYSKFDGYHSGGSGYVLSREALQRLVEHGLKSTVCRVASNGQEDLEIGHCLRFCRVKVADSKDEYNRLRFMPLEIENWLIPHRIGNDSWMHQYTSYKIEQGQNFCSSYAVSFHYVMPYKMYVLNYLIYNLQPFGISMGHEPLNRNLSELEQARDSNWQPKD
ncbi:uncharacterized protein LOC108594267 [Drosophila busckii]|uniref:uncharacterized protein LOC108594267 n=1 Tax=Drosophila busckii TaxID=30019 RepID=UPI001432FAEA|nr:uncharacterized protein LOC108594267 [Drosophila busckii]